MDRVTDRALRPGDRPAQGALVVLQRDGQEVEWFYSDGSWVCPRTINRFYYVVSVVEGGEWSS